MEALKYGPVLLVHSRTGLSAKENAFLILVSLPHSCNFSKAQIYKKGGNSDIWYEIRYFVPFNICLDELLDLVDGSLPCCLLVPRGTKHSYNTSAYDRNAQPLNKKSALLLLVKIAILGNLFNTSQ